MYMHDKRIALYTHTHTHTHTHWFSFFPSVFSVIIIIILSEALGLQQSTPFN